MIKRLSDKLALYLSENVEAYKDRADVLSYGLQIIISVLSKTITILLAAFILGTFKYTVISLLSYILFRRIVGGIHCSTFGNCFIVTFSMFITMSLLPKLIILDYSSSIYLLSLALFISSIITFLWVPSVTSSKKITDQKLRDKLKIKSLITLSLWFFILLLFIRNDYFQYVFSSILGAVTSFTLITPCGHNFINIIDSNIKKLWKEEKSNA